MKSGVLNRFPYWAQDMAISAYNTYLYRMRRAGSYREWREYFRVMGRADSAAVDIEVSRRLEDFLCYATSRSKWYRRHRTSTLADFPPLEKQEILESLDEIATVSVKDAVISLTGGTTGASMKVLYTLEDVRERFALVDEFRESYGYVLGERVAWFSGKSLATQRDVERGRCYRDDWISKIRFFSTFHVTEHNFQSYWTALEKFRPRFMVGFPSSIYDIARMAKERGLKASYEVVAVFTNAETLLQIHRDVIGWVFGARVVDQYGSAEGAPLILECRAGRMHLQPLSGVFEVLDCQGNSASEGELLVTSFSTRGTPLVRYRIGDRIKLSDSDARCECGSAFPLVDWIDGRATDFVWSPENGRINLGNLSNATKDIIGVRCFQIIQDDPNEIEVRVVGSAEFDAKQQEAFIAALRIRTGDMQIHLVEVDEIPREKSGKFRIVKNSIASEVRV